MGKYHIITFGCQMNMSDSERIASVLESRGYQPTSKENEADLIAVNMCSVRQSAVDRVYGLTEKLRNLKTKKQKLKTILTGCVLKKDKQKLVENFDFIWNIKDWQKLPQIPNLKKRQNSLIRPWQINKFRHRYLKIKSNYQNNFRAYIPISNGCNDFCSYCVVPYTRGKEKSRKVRKIVDKMKSLIKNGCKEIVLLGQNVNSYKDGGVNFPMLLKEINDIKGDFRFNFMTSHPKNMSAELIETMASCQKLIKEIHLPVQSGDNQILKKMNRHYTAAQYKKIIEAIRRKISGIKISTDIIVGFPGETKRQFENTVKLFKGINFDYAYIAKYSPRPGTAAYKMKDNVPLTEKKRREKILRNLIKK